MTWWEYLCCFVMALLFLSAFADEPKCYTSTDMKSYVCWALCRQEGASTGKYLDKKRTCLCGIEKDFKEFTESVIKILPEPRESSYRPWYFK